MFRQRFFYEKKKEIGLYVIFFFEPITNILEGFPSKEVRLLIHVVRHVLRRNFCPITPCAPRLPPPPTSGTSLLAKFPTPGPQGRGGGGGNCRN